jgi:hypothetical protein
MKSSPVFLHGQNTFTGRNDLWARPLKSTFVYRLVDVDVFGKSTGQWPTATQTCDLRARDRISTDSQQQYLARDPIGYRGIGGCRIPYKS